MAKLTYFAHIHVLKKMVYRLSGDLTEETRIRLNVVIRVYERLYLPKAPDAKGGW